MIIEKQNVAETRESPKMEMEDLKKRVYDALNECKSMLKNQPEIVFTEADFERLVSWALMKELGQADYKKPNVGDFTVHTQASHYLNGTNKPNKRVDILLLRKLALPKGPIKSRKIKYTGDSFAFELKYLRKDESIQKVKCDFCKRIDLEPKSLLYIVVCMETDDIKKIRKGKIELCKMKNAIIKNYPKYKGKLFYCCLQKRITEPDENSSNQTQ